MSKSKLIDDDLMAAIKGNADTGEIVTKRELNKLKKTEIKFDMEGNQQPFSKAFGMKPKRFADFPVRVYSPEDWDDSIRSRIPEVDKNYILNPKVVERIAYSMFVGGPTLTWGPTGTGKTSLWQQVAARLNIPFFRISCDEQMEKSEFLGTNSVVNNNGVPETQHSHTDVTLACTYGGMLVVDEVFRSPTLLTLQPLLEDKPALVLQDALGCERTLIPPKDKFFIGLTDNTAGHGDDAGAYLTQPQDLSTLDRIRTVIHVDYMSEAKEKDIIKKAQPTLPEQVVSDMIKIAQEIRKAHMASTMASTMSIRGLLNWAQDIVYMKDPDIAFVNSYFERLNRDDKNIVASAYKQVTTRNLPSI